jgi:hypothetical protein
MKTTTTGQSTHGSLRDRSLWGVLAVIPAFLFMIAANELFSGMPLDPTGPVIGLTIILLIYVGWSLRFGSVVPCMLLGIFFFSLFINPISHSPEEAAFQVFGAPLFGSLFGAAFGFVLESYPASCPDSKKDKDRRLAGRFTP